MKNRTANDWLDDLRVVPVTTSQLSHDHCDQLVSFLKKQNKAADELLQVAIRKKDALMSRDQKAFQQIVADESRLVDAMERVEGQRPPWMGPDHTLSDILASVPNDQVERVEAAAQQLMETIRRLDAVNQQNAGLMVHSISHVQMLIRALTGESERGNTYGPANKKGRAHQGRSLVEWRA